RGIADRVVLVLMVRFVARDGVVARPLAVVQALAESEGFGMDSRPDRQGAPPRLFLVPAGDYKYARSPSHRPMSQTYDVIVIGGHNGLVHAAYLARAGRKVLVLERRHLLGGAAVTEEVFPGFKFSVASYVVSLLRPEIIRELDLPRHGLEILPLDGTFTPMPNGDYLWRVNDHAKTRREIARHSRVDAEAYDEYGKAMVDMGRFVKPILSLTPPDPTKLELRGLFELLRLGRRFQKLPWQD